MFHAFFLPVEPGERFCVYHPPSSMLPVPRGIVYVHPFAEEMNKARRMAALQAASLATAGYGVLQMDLLGCGDSSGDFADARWEIWKKDVKAAIEWLRRELRSPVSLWGLRIGASLAAEVARDPGLGLEWLLLWQPVNNGEQFLTQFLRLRLAAEMLAEGSAQSGVRGLRQILLGGRPLEVAGYEVSPELAHAIDHLRLAESVPAVRNVLWLEVSGSPGGAIAPASQRTLDAWRSKGIRTDSATVAGAPFWSTVEIMECLELIAATMQWVQSRS